MEGLVSISFCVYALSHLPFPRKARVVSRPATGTEAAVTRGLCLALLVALLYIAVCKWLTGRMLYMLMPCHVLTVMLLVMGLLPAKLGADLYNVYVSYAFMPVLAVLFPDLRDYTLPFEVATFFIQHALMIALPVWFARTARFPVYEGRYAAWRAYALGTLAFYGFLVPLSAALGANLNYMMSPPPGVLRWFGRAYRPVQMVFCSVLLYLSNLVHKNWAAAAPAAKATAGSSTRVKRSSSASASASSVSASSVSSPSKKKKRSIHTQPPATAKAQTTTRSRSRARQAAQN